MPFNGSGTFTRTQNWTSDANNNLPISASKFDNEDNDFATAFNNCLTRDGQGAPSAGLTWATTLTLNKASDGAELTVGRTGGSNNPSFQVVLTDSSSKTQLNNTLSGGTISLALNGTDVAQITATGLSVLGGSSSSDVTLLVQNKTATSTFLELFGDGHGTLGPSASLGLSWTAAGALTIAAPSTGISLTVNGPPSASIMTLNAPTAASSYATMSTSASIFGYTGAGSAVVNGAGTTDYGITATNSLWLATGGGSTYAASMKLSSTGEVFMLEPTVANSPTIGHQVGYIDAPLRQINASTTLSFTDRGKSIELTGGSAQTLTFPSTFSNTSGAMVMVVNLSGNSWTLAASGTMHWLPSGSTGSRTLANNGTACMWQLGTDWYIVGGGGIT